MCSSLFWWLKGAGGSKCRKLVNGRGNPCRDEGFVWDVSVFEQAYLAYGQKNQWQQYNIRDTWGRAYSGGLVNGKYFLGYENCAASYFAEELSPSHQIKSAVRKFSEDVGLAPSGEIAYQQSTRVINQD